MDVRAQIHLEEVRASIGALRGRRQRCKVWCVLAFPLFYGLGVLTGSAAPMALFLVCPPVFWALDAHWLQQQRALEGYNESCATKPEEEWGLPDAEPGADVDVNVRIETTFGQALSDASVLPLYLGAWLSLGAAALYLLSRGKGL